MVGGGFDHQFYNNDRLDALEKKQNEYARYEANPIGQVPPEFTEEDAQEREKLLSEGFPNWNKRDFFKFINMCQIYGRDNIDMFQELFTLGKTLQQIQEYSDAFWKNYKSIKNHKKYIEKIEKGEQEILARNAIDQAIDDKFIKLRDDFLEGNPGKTEDDFMFGDIKIKYQQKQA